MHVGIEHGTRILQSRLTTTFSNKLIVLRKRRREHTPNPIGIQLQWTSHLFHKLTGLCNQRSASVGDDTCHLHTAPTRPLTHDITVERIENTLMSELQRIHQNRHVFCLPLAQRISTALSSHHLAFPYLGAELVFIAAVTKCTHSVDIKRVLSHTHRVDTFFLLSSLTLAVHTLRICL